MLNLLSDFKCRCAKMISYLQNLWVKWNLLWILKVVYNQKEWKPIVLLWMGLFWEEAGPVWRSAHLGPDISESTWPSPSLAQVCYQREGPSGGCGEEHVRGSGGAGRVKGPGHLQVLPASSLQWSPLEKAGDKVSQGMERWSDNSH